MGKSIIIGDIHGCIETFRELLNKLPDDIVSAGSSHA